MHENGMAPGSRPSATQRDHPTTHIPPAPVRPAELSSSAVECISNITSRCQAFRHSVATRVRLRSLLRGRTESGGASHFSQDKVMPLAYLGRRIDQVCGAIASGGLTRARRGRAARFQGVETLESRRAAFQHRSDRREQQRNGKQCVGDRHHCERSDQRHTGFRRL